MRGGGGQSLVVEWGTVVQASGTPVLSVTLVFSAHPEMSHPVINAQVFSEMNVE